jgi:hypothetical protein
MRPVHQVQLALTLCQQRWEGMHKHVALAWRKDGWQLLLTPGCRSLVLHGNSHTSISQVRLV